MKKRFFDGLLLVVINLIFAVFAVNGFAADISQVEGVKYDADAHNDDPDYNGQCVTFVKNARPELVFTWGNGYGEKNCDGKCITERRIKTAIENGFEVNDIPRIGAAFLINVPTKKDGFIAHTGIVTNVKLVEKDGKDFYVVNVRESNYTNPLKMDTRDEIYLPFPDTGWQFIQEKKTDYDAKQQQAIEQVIQVYKNLGKEPSDKEKKEYTEKLLSGVVSPEQIKATVIAQKPTTEDETTKTLKESDLPPI